MTGVSDAGIRKEGINKMRDMYYDVVIAGCGVAGLYTAVRVGREQKILMRDKEGLEWCDSQLAQGGICFAYDENDYDSSF